MKPREKKIKDAPDWFGCGRIITAKSWRGFLDARKKYFKEKDKRDLTKQNNPI